MQLLMFQMFQMFQMFDVAGHRMCKTRLKMMVSCGRLTRTTQLHPTGHHCDPDDDDPDDDADDDYKDDDDDGLVRLTHSTPSHKSSSWC